MSAVDEYRRAASKAWSENRRLMNPAGYFALSKADAAIAELEAETNRLAMAYSTQVAKTEMAERLCKQAQAELAALKWMLRRCVTVSTKYMAEHTGVEWHESDVDEALEHLDEAWAERKP